MEFLIEKFAILIRRRDKRETTEGIERPNLENLNALI